MEEGDTIDAISHLALDIGGSLIKMVYFSTSKEQPIDKTKKSTSRDSNGMSNGSKDGRLINGRLYFIKFETSKINECLDFVSSKQHHCRGVQQCGFPVSDKNIIKATGGGAFKFADLFKEKLGISLDKVDEMSSLVSGANFLLKVGFLTL
nr:pantothenate kinase 1 [Tanacetum cinerariifolium]